VSQASSLFETGSSVSNDAGRNRSTLFSWSCSSGDTREPGSDMCRLLPQHENKISGLLKKCMSRRLFSDTIACAQASLRGADLFSASVGLSCQVKLTHLSAQKNQTVPAAVALENRNHWLS